MINRCVALFYMAAYQKDNIIKKTMINSVLTLETLNFFYENLGGKSVFFQFESIIAVLVSSF